MSAAPATDTDRYTVISADGHADLPCEQYLQYL